MIKTNSYNFDIKNSIKFQNQKAPGLHQKKQHDVYFNNKSTINRYNKIKSNSNMIENNITSNSKIKTNDDPILLSLLKGNEVERTPVWMMRQAGRYMKIYRDLCKKYPRFRERSENVELSVEISLQPWKAFESDGVILFSDILTPLSGMNINFDIVPGKGPIIDEPIRTIQDVKKIIELEPEKSCSFVGETLKILKNKIKNKSTLLGFVGAPYTMASYIVEGGSSKNYTKLKEILYSDDMTIHALLDILSINIIKYIRYQADNGAQAIQIFDSWASNLSPSDFEIFSGKYLKKIIEEVRKTHPKLPIILYISQSGGLIERMAECNPDVISLCHTIDILDAIKRINSDIIIQGNLDPGILFGKKEVIEEKLIDLVKKVAMTQTKHILNLGHGVTIGTPEENVEHFFKIAKTINNRF